MTTSLQTQIHLIPVAELPRPTPDVVIVAGEESSLAELFRLPAPVPAPAGRPLRLFVRATTVNSPDRLEVLSAERDDRRITLHLELRAFGGLLGANLQSIAVVEAHLGPLVAGNYELAVTLHTMRFQSMNQPEHAQPGKTSTRTWALTIVP